jgi:Mn2+/Fe2+ NRAMP family transporter
VPWLDDCSRTAPPAPSQGWLECLGIRGWLPSESPAALRRKARLASVGIRTLIGVAVNFLGFNPMQALVWAGVIQGFSTPPLLMMIVLMTSSRQIMGDKVNSLGMNILGWITTVAIFAASVGLVVSWFI